MYELKSNFYPAKEPKGGYIGKANITIANAIRINNISVFRNEQNGEYNISFSEYGENNSYVIPKSKEAYAAMLGVVVKALEAEKHFAFEPGEYGPKFEVRGTAVAEKYADGRYSVGIGDLCTLNGITTRYVKTDAHSFVSVDMPTAKDENGKTRMYTTKSGKEVADLEFQGLVSTWTDKEGKEVSLDWGKKLADAVKKERLEIHPELKKNKLNEAIKAAEGEKASKGEKSKAAKQVEEPTL